MKIIAALLTLVGAGLTVVTIASAQADDCKLCREDYQACIKNHSQAACKTNYDICLKHCKRK